jgi:hypothetical protein
VPGQRLSDPRRSVTGSERTALETPATAAMAVKQKPGAAVNTPRFVIDDSSYQPPGSVTSAAGRTSGSGRGLRGRRNVAWGRATFLMRQLMPSSAHRPCIRPDTLTRGPSARSVPRMLVDALYRGYRIEVYTEPVDGAWDATARSASIGRSSGQLRTGDDPRERKG